VEQNLVWWFYPMDFGKNSSCFDALSIEVRNSPVVALSRSGHAFDNDGNQP